MFNVNDFLIKELCKSRNLFEQVEYQYILWYDRRKREGFGFNYEFYKENHPYLSSKITNRILKIIPKFLDKDKRLYILKNLIVEFLISKAKLEEKKIKKVQITELYILLKNKIEEFSRQNISWFIENKIIDENEVEEYLQICKSVTYKILKDSYENVINDINISLEKTKIHSSQFKKVIYRIDLLDIELDLKKLKKNIIFNEKMFEIDGYNFSNLFVLSDSAFMIEELIKLNVAINKSSINILLISKDLDLISNKLSELGKNKTTLNLTLNGGGGILVIYWHNNLFNRLFNYLKI